MRLKQIKLNGKISQLSNIVIVIGANNSGKTKLLDNLNDELMNSYERSSSSDYARVIMGTPYWNELTDENYFEFGADEVNYWLDNHEDWRMPQNQPNGGQMLMRSKKHILQWAGGEPIALNQDEITSIKTDVNNLSEWLVKLKKSHIEYAGIEVRFTASNVLDNVDAANDDNPNLIYIQKKTVNNLNKHISKLFSKILVLLKVSKTAYSLILIDDNQTDIPVWAKSNTFEADTKTIKDHTKFKDKYPNGSIGLQSHGTRASLSLLMILADATRKIVLIDEPESHIYPVARKYLARQIALESVDRQFFIVTHDVDFLEGIANSRKDFTVIKVNRLRETKVIDFNATERRRTSSELKNSKALRAGFYDVAIFVEGTGDKYVYDSILVRKKLIPQKIEYGLIDCDGKDKIADSVKFALDIGTAVAVITDFDTLLTSKKIAGKMVGHIDRIIDPFVTDDKIKKLAEEVRKIMKGRPNKNKGLRADGLTKSDTAKINQLLDELKKVGIFVVPYGELYSWFGTKSKADLAVEDLRNRYFNNSKNYVDLTNFLRQVSIFVSNQ